MPLLYILMFDMFGLMHMAHAFAEVLSLLL
nr:MAG TPA: hypothetical protein [Caudoviricetes sp.]